MKCRLQAEFTLHKFPLLLFILFSTALWMPSSYAQTGTNEAEKNRNLSFEEVILKGEESYKLKDYPVAKRYFEKALEIDPSSRYAKDRLTAIRGFYTDPEDVAKYNAAMEKGNRELSLEHFDQARNWFEIALAAQPDSRAAKDKLAETDRSKADKLVKRQQYDKLVADADKLFQAEKRTEAREIYQKAAGLLPDEPVAKQKINEIDSWFSAKKAIQDAYDKAVEQADQFYINRDFTNARLKYQEALKAKPEARYPKEMLEKSGQGEQQAQSDQEKYDAAIASADAFFKSGDMEAALTGYQTGLSIQPGSQYAKDKIREIETSQKERSSRKEAYDIAIKNGDQAFSESRYDVATGHYKNALTLFPDENYPKEQLASINRMIDKRKTDDKQYNILVAAGDKYAAEKNYDLALSKYQEASTLKPDEKYPPERISAINQLLLDKKDLNERYAKAIATGDSLFGLQKYEPALTSYNTASSLKAAEKYPREKISAINSILAKRNADQKKYNDLIAQGDQAFSAKNYPVALSSYKSAAVIKPAEQYPNDQISSINQLMLSQKELDEKYSKAIADGDAHFGQKEYELALASYKEAGNLKPAEKYPAQKIDQINALVTSLKEKEDAYNSALSTADDAFGKKDYDAATASYKKALLIKPGEQYPADQLAAVATIKEELKKTDDAFNKALADADRSYREKNYAKAVAGYESALKIKPMESYPTDQIHEINALLADQAAKQNIYDQAVAKGDQAMQDKNYQKALSDYQEALTAKPDEVYPSEQIKKINGILEEIRIEEENYTKAVNDGDRFFQVKKYREALEPYERALTYKPEAEYPRQQKEKISQALAEQKALDDQYASLLASGEQELKEQKYQPALTAFRSASDLKPEESYPKEKISTIEALLAEIQARDDAYNKALAEGDARLASNDLNGALISFTEALRIKPSESYPSEKSAYIKAELKAIDERYSKVINDADTKLSGKAYADAINLYQQALEIKPLEKYPGEKISEINAALVKEKEEQERLYSASVAEGDQLLGAGNYVDAKRSYMKASGIKPAEQYPKDKLIEINLVLDARAKALKDEYEKAIVDADKLYQQKILDQAIEAYEKAASIKADEAYPGEMIRKIKQYIVDHAILDLNKTPLVIAAGDEHKFTFAGIEPKLRSNNYVMIRAKAIGNTTPKVYFNYGRDNAKNGGIVLRTIGTAEGVDYLIRLAGQDKWYREDNNWISLYTEGCAIEVEKIQLSQGE